MAIYSERNANSILTFATDPEGAPMFISKVNGDPGLVGAAVGLSIGGAATVAFDGTVTYDDTGLPTVPVGTELADSLIATVSDGLNEVDVTVNLEILGITDVSAVSAEFGALTRAGAGGIAVTGTSITSGDPAGYFAISGGLLSVSSSGQGQVSGLYVLGLDDGSQIEIQIIANRFDVANDAEFPVALAAAEAINPLIDYEVVIRDGTVIGAPMVPLNILQITMGGALVDPNQGVANSVFDKDAVASFSGGSITIRPETKHGVTVSAPLSFIGCDKIHLKDLVFDNAATEAQPASFYYADANSFHGPASTTFQIRITEDGWMPSPVRGTTLIEGCLFTAPAGKNPGRWAPSIIARENDILIVQDCSFDKVLRAAQGFNLNRWSLIRNSFINIVEDHIRCFGNSEPAATPVRFEVVSNTIQPVLDDVNFAGAHVDCVQVGTTVDARDLDIFIHGNYFYAPIPARVYPGETASRSSQGVFSNFQTSSATWGGEISNNFICVASGWGIGLDNADFMVVKNNTVIRDTLSVPNLGQTPWIFVYADATSCVVQNNITGQIISQAGAGAVYLNNFDGLDHAAPAGVSSFAAVFNGPFGHDPSRGATFAVDQTDVASLRASIDSIFATKPGGAGEGRGHLNVS